MKNNILVGLAALAMGCSTPYSAALTPAMTKQEVQYCGIAIEGFPTYTQNIIEALDLIYYRDQGNWSIVQNNITVIRFNPPSRIDVYTGVFDTDANITTSTQYQPLQWVAGEIVHDAWHREYFRRGEIYNGWEGEKKCMERQNEFFTKIRYPLVDVEKKLQTRYWETQRNW
ncbi:MAG: hypothetical protein Q7S55_02915 [Nanoarchaeota archaeon]|nr:hypothetical protein [Nanoarchaeota archaeon]